jgi:C4-dicarboxylate-specific signal transduction histidine kinase
LSKFSPLWSARAPAILSLTVGILSVAAALVAGLLLDTYLQSAPFVSLFFCAIIFAAWFGGVGPGIFAAVLSILAFVFFFVPPINSLAMEFKDIPRIILFVMAVIFVLALSGAQQTAAESLRRARDDLQVAVKELARLNKMLDEAQWLSHTGSFGWRVSTGQILWSDETFRIFQYDRTTEPTAELILQRVHPDDRPLVEQTIERASRDGKGFDFEHRLLMPDGSIKYLHIVAHALKNDSGSTEFVGAVMDVTAAKRAEDELHKAQEELAYVSRATTMGELAASVAHEVNQPLAAVVTNGEACLRWLDRDVPELDEARRAVRRMIGEGRRANQVIGRVRAMVRRQDPQKAPVDLNDVIDETVPLVRRELASQRVTLNLELEPGLPPVTGDRIQLQQVIMNLLVNGIQAMADVSDRPRELLVRTRRDKESGLLVQMRDSGIGIDPKNMHRLFNSFFTTKEDGMGMGLSICRSIIEVHGGRIWASPNAGPGATFQFALPPGETGAR